MNDVSAASLARSLSSLRPPCASVLAGRRRRPVAAVACLAAALLLRPPAAFAQDEGRWSDGDGTWSGDEGPAPGGGWDRAAPRDPYDTWDRQRDRERAEERERDRERYERDRERQERDRERWREEREREREAREDRDDEDRDTAIFVRSGPSMVEFRESLTPYGQWIETPEYGLVWRPASADDFRPYYAGRWAWTDAGWYWVADEPYGWAVYHYGRWAYVSGLGWSWLPGRIWAPAWVSWRWGEGYAGWCPLGPRGVVYEQPAYFVMVPQQEFLAPVQHAAVPIVRAARFFPQTFALPVAGAGPLAGAGPRAGPRIGSVARAVGHAVRPLPIADAPAPPRGPAASLAGGVVFAYRPRPQPIVRGAGSGPAGGGAQNREGSAARWSDGLESTSSSRSTAPLPHGRANPAPRPAPAPAPALAPAPATKGPRSEDRGRPTLRPSTQARADLAVPAQRPARLPPLAGQGRTGPAFAAASPFATWPRSRPPR